MNRYFLLLTTSVSIVLSVVFVACSAPDATSKQHAGEEDASASTTLDAGPRASDAGIADAGADPADASLVESFAQCDGALDAVYVHVEGPVGLLGTGDTTVTNANAVFSPLGLASVYAETGGRLSVDVELDGFGNALPPVGSYPFGSSGPGIVVALDGDGCAATGGFTVRAAEASDGGTVLSALELTFAFRCNVGASTLDTVTGCLRYTRPQ